MSPSETTFGSASFVVLCQLCGEIGHSFQMTPGIAPFEDNVLSFDVSERTQTLDEGSDPNGSAPAAFSSAKRS